MAVPTLSNVPTIINLAETTGTWSGTTVALETDLKLEGNGSISCILRADGSTIQGTAGTSFSGTNQHIRGWIQFQPVATLDFMEMYLVGNNTAYWEIFSGAGSASTAPLYEGGWYYAIIDFNSTQDSGTKPTNNITALGFRFQRVSAPANRTNTFVDAFYYGDGYTATGGTSGDPITFATIADVDVVEAYGIVQSIRDTNFLFGAVTIGSGATSTYMTVENEAVIFADAPVSSTLYNITATGSGCTFDATNSLFKANGLQTFDFDMSAVNTLICNGNVFIRAGSLTFTSGQTITSNTFIDCGTLTTGGATVVRGAFSTCDPVIVSDLSQLSLCTFVGDNTQAAVELTSLGTGTMNWSCDATNGYATGSSGTFTTANDAGADGAIFVNVASGTLTINVVSGGTIPSIRTAGATVTVQQTVTFSIENIVAGSEVRLFNQSDLSELGGGQSGIIGATFTATPFNTNAQGANPSGLAVDGTFVYITAGNLGNLYKYNYAGTLQTSWSVDSFPAGVAYFNNTVYVAGITGSNVVAYSTTGTPTGFSFSTAGEITQESGLCFDGTHFYIADRSTDRVYRYNSNGTYSNFFFSVATEDTDPRGIEVIGDYIYVSGFSSDRVYKYSKDGVYQGISWSTSGQSDFTTGLSYDGNFFWQAGNDNRNVFYYTPVVSSSEPGIEEIGTTTPGLGWTVEAEDSPPTRYTANYSYSYSADTPVFVTIVDVEYEIIRLDETLGNTSRSIKINQIFDRNYDEGDTPYVNP